MNTIVHLTGNAFRAAPWLMVAAMAGGFWLTGFATRLSVHAMQTFLNAHRLYEIHPDAYLFWLKFPLQIGRVVLCTLVGGLVALAARRREMAAVIGLALVEMAVFVVGTVAVIAGGRDWFHWFLVMLLWNGLSSTATVLGGAIVRTCRPAAVSRHAAA